MWALEMIVMIGKTIITMLAGFGVIFLAGVLIGLSIIAYIFWGGNR